MLGLRPLRVLRACAPSLAKEREHQFLFLGVVFTSDDLDNIAFIEKVGASRKVS